MLSKQEFDRRVIESLSTTKYILPSAIVLQKNFSTVVYKMFEPFEIRYNIYEDCIDIQVELCVFICHFIC